MLLTVCGAVLLPRALALEMEAYLHTHSCEPQGPLAVPRGLARYLSRFEVPRGMPYLRRFLQLGGGLGAYEEWVNVGLYLRWQVGLRGLEKFHSLSPALVEQFTRRWVLRVGAWVLRAAPWVRILEEGSEGSEKVSGIVSFCVFVPAESGQDRPLLRRLGLEELKELHRRLAVPAAGGRPILLGCAGVHCGLH
jgi:hypothetical protein